jgi:hypothetical protein
MWEWKYRCTIFNLGAGWGTELGEPINRRMSGPQSRFGLSGEEKDLLPLPGFEPWIIQPVA